MPESVSRRSWAAAMPSIYARGVRVVVKLFAGLRERAGVAQPGLGPPAGGPAAGVCGAPGGPGGGPGGGAGVAERELELADGARVADVWAPLGLGQEPGGLVYAVNRSYVERDRVLADGGAGGGSAPV